MDYDIIACIINYGMIACRCKMGHHFTSACYNAIVDKKLCSNGGYGDTRGFIVSNLQVRGTNTHLAPLLLANARYSLTHERIMLQKQRCSADAQIRYIRPA